jgi:hypothetical protein
MFVAKRRPPEAKPEKPGFYRSKYTEMIQKDIFVIYDNAPYGRTDTILNIVTAGDSRSGKVQPSLQKHTFQLISNLEFLELQSTLLHRFAFRQFPESSMVIECRPGRKVDVSLRTAKWVEDTNFVELHLWVRSKRGNPHFFIFF